MSEENKIKKDGTVITPPKASVDSTDKKSKAGTYSPPVFKKTKDNMEDSKPPTIQSDDLPKGRKICKSCDGAGKLENKKCDTCNGNGHVKDELTNKENKEMNKEPETTSNNNTSNNGNTDDTNSKTSENSNTNTNTTEVKKTNKRPKRTKQQIFNDKVKNIEDQGYIVIKSNYSEASIQEIVEGLQKYMDNVSDLLALLVEKSEKSIELPEDPEEKLKKLKELI